MSFIAEKIQIEGLTFDDTPLVPAYSDALPHDVKYQSLSFRLKLKYPVNYC